MKHLKTFMFLLLLAVGCAVLRLAAFAVLNDEQLSFVSLPVDTVIVFMLALICWRFSQSDEEKE